MSDDDVTEPSAATRALIERDELRELLRQHVLDWGACDVPDCECSHARALRKLGITDDDEIVRAVVHDVDERADLLAGAASKRRLFERLRSGEHVALPEPADDEIVHCGCCAVRIAHRETTEHLESCRWYRWAEQ